MESSTDKTETGGLGAVAGERRRASFRDCLRIAGAAPWIKNLFSQPGVSATALLAFVATSLVAKTPWMGLFTNPGHCPIP